MADKNKENKDRIFKVSLSKNGNYFVVESSYDGGKTWHFVDSSPDWEEANLKRACLESGLTASGLTPKEAKASIPEGTPTIGDSDQNSKTKSTKKENKDRIFRVSPSKNGNYYVVESSYDDGKTWHYMDSSPDQEKANRIKGYLEKGLTTSGLTTKQASDMVKFEEDEKKWMEDAGITPEEVKNLVSSKDTSTNDNSDQNSETESTKETPKNNVNTLTQYEIDHPNFTENNKNPPKSGGSASTANPNDVITTEITNGAATIDEPSKKSSYWTNFLYGNDKGSVQNDKEAKAEKEKKMDDFLKNNPNLVKAIFGKNSGLNFGERVARLGEMLAMIGADATKGAYAGFNHQALPEATKGRYSEIYNNALKNQYERKQDIFESENKANIDKANRISILKSSPILSKLDDDMLSQLADKTVTGITEAEWDNYENDLQKKGYNTQEIEEIKSTFNTLRNTFSDITTQRGNVVELNGKEFDLMRKPQQAIAELQAQKAKLNEQLVQVRTLKYEQLKSFLQSFKSTYAGIQSVSDVMSENKEFGYDASAYVKGGKVFVEGSASAGVKGGKGSEKSTGTNTDKLALEGLQTGKIAAEEWNKDTATYRKLIEDSIKEAIKEIDNQIAALKNFHSIDDGIVKAPHMKQWLVREDGTRIALNPSDNIYATKNKLTTKKDNKSEDVVPMEKEDKVVVIQKKLGHNCDKRIIKNNDYYLSKLK